MTERNPDADISHYRTFALLPLPDPGSAKDPARALLLAQAARETTVSTLVAKGFVEAPPSQADFSVGLRGQSLPKETAAATGFGTSVRTGRGRVGVYDATSGDGLDYDERTLRVEVFDNRTREMVWAGWMSKLSAVPSQSEEVQKAVRRILSKFPSATAPTAKQP
jgi:hypothetical protein